MEEYTCHCCGKTTALMYVHSKCCHVHWELVVNTHTGHYQLVCEECHKVAVPGQHIEFVSDE